MPRDPYVPSHRYTYIMVLRPQYQEHGKISSLMFFAYRDTLDQKRFPSWKVHRMVNHHRKESLARITYPFTHSLLRASCAPPMARNYPIALFFASSGCFRELVDASWPLPKRTAGGTSVEWSRGNSVLIA